MNYKTEWQTPARFASCLIAKNINKMAFPILLNYLLTSIFELLDKAIIGHYSTESFAVVGIAASILYAITGALGVLSGAFNIVAAKEKGCKDDASFRHTFMSSKLLTVFIGLFFFLICIINGQWFFESIYKIKGAELKELLFYFYPASFTVLQNMLIFQYSVYFRNQLNTKITLYSTIVSTVVNLFFDYTLVYGVWGLPELGASGTAWGSIIGLSAGLVIYQLHYYSISDYHKHFVITRVSTLFHAETLIKMKEILKLYPSLLGQEFLEGTILVTVVSGVVARLGTKEMAVYNLLDIVLSILTLPVYAYATATQTYSLQASAKQNQSAKRYLKSGFTLSVFIVLTLCILCELSKEPVFSFILSDKMIIEASFPFLRILFGIVIIKIPYQIYMNYLQGIGKERFVFLCTAASTTITSIIIILLEANMNLTILYLIILLESAIIAVIYALKTMQQQS